MKHFYQSLDGFFDFESLYAWAVYTFPAPAHFVEVGSFFGKSTAFLAVEILNSGKAITLDAVDTFRGNPEHRDPKSPHFSQVVVDGGMFDQFCANMAPVMVPMGDLFRIRQQSSVLAAADHANGALDFVFLDAQHKYEAIRADLNAWGPKVRFGGVLGGHDIAWPGVRQAVREYFAGCIAFPLPFVCERSWAYRLGTVPRS